MGRRGPPPKPIELKIIEGNPGHQPLAEPIKPRPVTPNRPEWLLPEAKREWSRVVPELERLGLLTIVDRAALAGYCQAFARAVWAEKALAEFGETFTTPSGYVQQRPEIAIANKAWQTVRAFCAEFGLTPAGRARMAVVPKADASICDGCGMPLDLCGCRTANE